MCIYACACFALLSDSSDFVQLTSPNQFLNEFGHYKRRQCFNVTVIDDSTGKNHEMTIVLAKPSNERHLHIRIHPGMIMIVVTDNDNHRCPLPTSPSQTRQQAVDYRCPDRGTDGYICCSRGIDAPIHVMTSLFKFTT